MSHRLGVRGIGKCFRTVAALSDVDLDVGAGEIVAVVGENGAGKSTLLKIVAGLLQPDSGALEWEGSKVRFSGPRDALARGIVLIHQELELASNLDVAANISLGREQRRFGCIDHHGVTRDARRWLDAVGAEFPPETPVANLTTGNQQLVEIAKALSREASLLVMDEPTSSLSASETARLLRLVQDLADRGLAVLYVSHRLAEVQTLADRVVVLRDGRVSGRLTGEGISRDRIVRAMVGRDLARSERTPREVGDIALSVCGLRTQRFPEARVSFDVRRGEILGLAGLVGAGRTELLSAIFGLERPLAGTMTVFGQAYTPAHPRAALNAGIGLVPEDRKLAALFLELAVSFNASIAVLERTTRWGLSSARREQALMRPLLERVQLAGGCGDPPIAGLSGGNQQKVILARWLALEPRILLLDEPTRGIDVGARQQIYDLVLRLAAEGLAVVLASSEMEEVLTLPDRVLVLRDGRITGELWDESRTEEAIMSLATAESP